MGYQGPSALYKHRNDAENDTFRSLLQMRQFEDQRDRLDRDREDRLDREEKSDSRYEREKKDSEGLLRNRLISQKRLAEEAERAARIKMANFTASLHGGTAMGPPSARSMGDSYGASLTDPLVMKLMELLGMGG